MASWSPSGDRPGRSDSSLTVNDDNSEPSSSQLPHRPHSPQGPQLGRRALTELDLAAYNPRRNRVARGGEREWTVFGQLMQDSGQLRTPDISHSVKKRHSQRSIRASVPSTTMPSRPESILQEGTSVVQSPVQETFPELERTSAVHTDYDSVSGPGSDSESSTSVLPPPSVPRRWRIPEIPILYRNILKCAVAYFLGSLWTYVTPLSLMIGSITSGGDRVPFPSGHMVATVTVYFNPAKSVGAMLEADLFCLYGLAWASLISLGSMAMFWWIDVKPGWEWLADVTVITWIGLGMTAVAFMKLWMAKPTFNTACSMTSIILFVVVVKEGGPETLLQVAKVVFVGSTISNLVCYCLWPQTAYSGLQKNITRTLDSFATLLDLLTRTFLISDSEATVSQSHLQRAVNDHQASFTGLKKNLTEARGEWLLGGAEAAQTYEDAVGCMNRLAQHLNGLRSGTRLQTELAQAAREGRIVLDRNASSSPRKDLPAETTQKDGRVDDSVTLQIAAHIFEELIDDMGPPLKALSNSCTNTLRQLRNSFAERQDSRTSDIQRFVELTDGIQRALFTFESTSNQAVMRVYRRSNLLASETFSSAAESIAAMNSRNKDLFREDENQLLMRSGADETVFLVYFFIFTLQEFAKELTALTEIMCRIYAIEHTVNERWWRKLIQFFAFSSCKERTLRLPTSASMKQRRPTLSKRFSTFILPNARQGHPIFPKVRPHAPNTLLTPGREQLSFVQRVGQSIWRLNETLKQNTVKFAFKAGMATALLASPAFFDRTRPIFTDYRGEWALISFFVVISPTIGATNFLSLHRVLGTLLGAVVAVAAFTLFPENPVALSIFGFFYSIPCFYYIVAKPQYATSGRFVLLTYNLTCLYCYNVRQDDVPVTAIAFRRTVAVATGVIYAGVVSRLWWPSEARRELSSALSSFCLNIGWLYTHLVAANSGILVRASPSQGDLHREAQEAVNGVERDLIRYTGTSGTTETARLLPSSVSEKLNGSIQTFMAMELHLQIKLIELQELLKQTAHEPRLKGPFPIAMYRSILTSLQTILDRLHSMRCVTTREEWHTSVRQDFVLPVNRERREMVGNVILYLSVLSAAFKLKTPLPPYLPPAEKSRQRLVEAIRELDIVKNRDVRGSQQLLFFAYALTMKGVIQELDFLGRTLQDAFGVIGQSREEFEAMFRPNGQIDKLV
ncbi:hypothetical protein ACEPAF_7935 [Sanghuangporus sanghuang]